MAWILPDGGGAGGRGIQWLSGDGTHGGGGPSITSLLKKLKEERENKNSDE